MKLAKVLYPRNPHLIWRSDDKKADRCALILVDPTTGEADVVTTLHSPADYHIWVLSLEASGTVRGSGGEARTVIVPNAAYLNALKVGHLGADVEHCQSVGAR